MSKRSLRRIPAEEYLVEDFASIHFSPPEDVGFGPDIAVQADYLHLMGYIDDLRLSSNANGCILQPLDTINALERYRDMNTWLTCLYNTLQTAIEWRDAIVSARVEHEALAKIMGSLAPDADDNIFESEDAKERVSDLEDLLYTAVSCAWESLIETKRRRLTQNWNYRVRSQTVEIANDSILIGTDDDDPMIRDTALLELEPLLQDHAWLFFMRALYMARPSTSDPTTRAAEYEFISHCYEIGESDLLVTDMPLWEYTMQDAITAYSLFLRATYMYPYSTEMFHYEKDLAVALARLLATRSEQPRIDYNMAPFVSNRAVTHLREASGEETSFGIKQSFFRFTDVLVFPTKMRLQTISTIRARCLANKGQLEYPSPRTEVGYKYWRSIAYRLVQLNYMVATLEDSYFRNEFSNFPADHIYQSGLMENELLRFSLERPGQEPDPASIIETLREKDYIDLNAMAKEMPHYFCANYTHHYLKWMHDRLGVETAEFMNDIPIEETIERFTTDVPLSAAARCAPLEKTCWPPNLPPIQVLHDIPDNIRQTFARGISDDDADAIRREVEFRHRGDFDNIAFFCYMYILNAWGRRASQQHHIYPDYVITDLIYRSDQIQEIMRIMEQTNTADTIPYLIYVSQQCYIYHHGRYQFCAHFSEAIERYIAIFVSAGHIYRGATEDVGEDDHADGDIFSVHNPFVLRNQSFLFHTDRRREDTPTFGVAPRLR